MNKNKILKAISFLSFAGILVASYSLYGYFFGSADSLCNINATFNCSAVINSGYSDIFGVPVALIGLVGYVVILFLSRYDFKGKILNSQNLILGITIPAVLFSGYLAFISGFVIKVWCPTCMVSYGIILTLFVLAVLLKRDIDD